MGDLAGLAALIAKHPGTSAEVAVLCKDLQVLGRSEFKQLLKWRLAVKRDLAKEMARLAAGAAGAEDEEEGGEEGKEGGEGSEGEEEEDAEERLLREMGEMRDRMDRRRHRERKRRKELKNKARQRAVQLAAAEGIGEDAGPESLFSLSGIKGRAAVAGVAEAVVPDSSDAGSSSDGGLGAGSDGSALDSEDEQRRCGWGWGEVGDARSAAASSWGLCDAARRSLRMRIPSALLTAYMYCLLLLPSLLPPPVHRTAWQVRRGDGRVPGGVVPLLQAAPAHA